MEDRYDDRYRGARYQDQRWRDRNERGFIDRASDEVRSWFGDEEADRRRRMVDGDRDWTDRDWGWRDRDSRERDWRDRDSGDRTGRAQSWRASERSNRDWDDRPRSERDWMDRGRADWDENRAWRAQSEYGYAQPYRPAWPSRDERRGWRTGDTGRDRGWRGDYLATYGSDDAPSRVGGYAGRGPKGYQRADARIQEDVSDRLADAPDVDATDITVTVSNGEVTLVGHVPDRWQKHRAEDLVEEISGVREVHNQLRVNRAATSATVAGATAAPPATTTATRR